MPSWERQKCSGGKRGNCAANPSHYDFPASYHLIAGHIIGRKNCPALYTCVCNYFSNWGDKWHDWFPYDAPGRQGAFLLKLWSMLWVMSRRAPSQTYIFHHWWINPQPPTRVWPHLLPPSHTLLHTGFIAVLHHSRHSCPGFTFAAPSSCIFSYFVEALAHMSFLRRLPWTSLFKISFFYSIVLNHTSRSSV